MVKQWVKRHRALVGYVLMALGTVGAFWYSDHRVDALTKVQGRSLCRQHLTTSNFKPTKDIPKSVIDKALADIQQSRRELGLKPCKSPTKGTT